MKCIVVDDEPLARRGMDMLIKEIPDLDLVGIFPGIVEAGGFLNENSVDIVFLDIQMPLLTGIDFLKVTPNTPMVVITTAYPEYALESFEFNVVDYLTKPIKFERFYKAVSKCRSLYELSNKVNSKEKVKKEEDSIFVRSNKKYVKVFFNKISHIEALKDYVIIHYESERLPVSVNLKAIEGKLPQNKFIRINKSYIINIDFVKSIDNDVIRLFGAEFFIGDNYKDNLMNIIRSVGLIKRDY